MMKKGLNIRALFTTLLILIVCNVNLCAQSTDYGMWSDVDISKKLNKKMTLVLEEEFRLRNELKTTDKFQSTFEFDYKLNDYFTAGASYTLINYYHPGNKKHDYQNYWETRNRFNIFGEGDYDLGRFNFSLRERFQSTYRVLDSVSTASVNPKFILRSKLSVSYNIPKIPVEPYAYCELFNVLNGTDKSKLEECRLSAGLKYKVSKKLSLKAGYIFSNEMDTEEGEKSNVASIGLSYKL
jgi:hypothetical protein